MGRTVVRKEDYSANTFLGKEIEKGSGWSFSGKTENEQLTDLLYKLFHNHHTRAKYVLL